MAVAKVAPSFGPSTPTPVRGPNSSSLEGFQVLSDTHSNDASLPPFMVSLSRGFLPREDPIIHLPPEFEILECLLARMPIVKEDGTPGLLATGGLGPAVESELIDLSPAIEKYRENLPVINALYRDYAFLTSAYLLEPCHLNYLNGQGYGLARDRLPRTIAVPMALTAEISGFKPWMEYAGSYALYNYRVLDPAKPLQIDNLSLVRAFDKGLDKLSSEAGFVLVHVSMAAHSGALVTAAMNVLQGCVEDDRLKFTEGLLRGADALIQVNKALSEMWTKNKPSEYATFRTFLFGTLNQTMFPNGVIYEGVSEEPLSFRGGSGANDSMIPLCDVLLEIRMPESPLTETLEDFRKYRPGNHREFLVWIQNQAKNLGIRKYAFRDPGSSLAYLKMLDQVRQFRWRHWKITKIYVLKRTKHQTATGGSDIVHWLPNQLSAVLEQILSASLYCNERSEDRRKIVERARMQLDDLRREVANLSRGVGGA